VTAMTRGAAVAEAVWEALAEVPDPEIPAVSVVDLGVVRSVQLDGELLRVELLPTFVGCPALDLIRDAVAERLEGMAPRVDVEVTFAEPWTSDRITPEGRRKLRESGFAPPERHPSGPGDTPLFATITTRPTAVCPYCGSSDTGLENPFGPTLCRAIFYCNRCRQPFEQFKTV
jgi:ring-1,2-phenylacetyl-CoA epoxidase subunit PaaD